MRRLAIGAFFAILSAASVGQTWAQQFDEPGLVDRMKAQWQEQCDRGTCSLYRFTAVAVDNDKKEPIEGKYVTVGVVVNRETGELSVIAFEIPDVRKGAAVGITFYTSSADGDPKHEDTVILPFQRCTDEGCLTGAAAGRAQSSLTKQDVDVLGLFQNTDLMVFNYFLNDVPHVAAMPLLGFKEAYGELMAKMEMGER